MRRKTTEVRFRFNLEPQKALDLLTAFYLAEINDRQEIPDLNSNCSQILIQLAMILTDECPKFGLMFCGNVGNGKTTLMKALRKTINYLDSKNHFEFLDDKEFGRRYKPQMIIVDVRDILKAAKEDGKKFDEFKKSKLLGIDDLGKEPAEIMDYGNIISPVIELLEYRYDSQLFTVITTNLVGREVREKYGDRIADRFNEMLSQIVFKNKSYRG